MSADQSGRSPSEVCDRCGSDRPAYRQATVGGSYTVRCYDEKACAEGRTPSLCAECAREGCDNSSPLVDGRPDLCDCCGVVVPGRVSSCYCLPKCDEGRGTTHDGPGLCLSATAHRRERLAEMLRWGEIHHRECATADPPPGPFPCDCEVPDLLRSLLSPPARTATAKDGEQPCDLCANTTGPIECGRCRRWLGTWTPSPGRDGR